MSSFKMDERTARPQSSGGSGGGSSSRRPVRDTLDRQPQKYPGSRAPPPRRPSPPLRFTSRNTTPDRRNTTPDRRSGSSRVTATSRGSSPTGRDRREDSRQRDDRRPGSSGYRGRARGFHFGKNAIHPQHHHHFQQNGPYFKNSTVRGSIRGRGTLFRYRQPDEDAQRRKVLLETPMGRAPAYRGGRGPSSEYRQRGSQTRDDYRGTSVNTNHDNDYFTRDIYELSPPFSTNVAPRPSSSSLFGIPNDRLLQNHHHHHHHHQRHSSPSSPCETTSQEESSSGSVIYNSSHKRSMEMVMRDCSPVSDDDKSSGNNANGNKRPREEPTTPVGPDSTTLCDDDMDFSLKMDAETGEAEELPVVETDFGEIFRLTAGLINSHSESSPREDESEVALRNFTSQAPAAVVDGEDFVEAEGEKPVGVDVEGLIDRAWESEVAPCEVSDVSALFEETAAQPSSPEQSPSRRLSESVFVESVLPVALITSPPSSAQPYIAPVFSRKRSNSCPPSESTPLQLTLKNSFATSTSGKSEWLTNILETENANHSMVVDSHAPRSFADLMSLLPSCEAITQIDLSTYQPPLFFSKFSWVDPFAHVRQPLRTQLRQSELTVFFDTLHQVEDAELPHPVGSTAFTELFQKLQDSLDFAISNAVWFRASDAPDEQLGVHFLHAIKMCLLEQLRAFPNVTEPDHDVTGIAMDMLLQAMIHVDGLADCVAQLGITADLTDIAFSALVASPQYRKLACCLLETFVLRVTHYPNVKSFAELMRKNGTAAGGSMVADRKGPLQRVQLLLELRSTIEAATTASARPLADLAVRDTALTATVQRARDESNGKILSTLVQKIESYRANAEKAGARAIDGHAAVYVCLRNTGFTAWFLDLLRQTLADGNADYLRKSVVLDQSIALLALLVDDECGPVYLADRASHLGDIVHVLHEIAEKSAQEGITELLHRVVYSLEVRRAVDMLSVKHAPTVYCHLTALLLRMNGSQLSGSFFTTPSTFHAISQAAIATPTPADLKMVFVLMFSQYDHPGLLSFADKITDFGKTKQIDLPLWKSLHLVCTCAKNAESSAHLMQTLYDELDRLSKLDHLSAESLASAHVVLDTLAWLCRTDCFHGILKSQKLDTFLRLHNSVVQHFRAAAVSLETVDCLDNLLWESVWVNCVRILFLHGSALGKSSSTMPLVPEVKGTFLEMMTGWSVLQDAGAPLRIKTRRAIQAEIGLGSTAFVEQVLNAESDAQLLETVVSDLVKTFAESAAGHDADVSAVVAYCAFFNTIHPSVCKPIAGKVKNKPLLLLSRRKNWEMLNKLEYEPLQAIISTGLCCTIPEADTQFRLWFWRYCEMSDSCLQQAVTSLLLIVCGSAVEELDGDVLVLMIEKLAAFLRIPLLKQAVLSLLATVEPESEWRPEMFDALVQLLRQGPVYTQSQRRIFLLPVANVFARLLDSVGVVKGTVVGLKTRDVTSAVLFRLEKEASVPVIISLWPILHQLFQSDSGILAFLNEAGSQPVLNWILVGIAMDLRADPEVPSNVTLAEKVVASFHSLSKRSVGLRCLAMADLRTLANMVVAHTRNCDPENPTYRIPQNKDPDAILSAHYGDLDCLTYSVPETVALFQQVMQKMLADFSRNGDASRQCFRRRSDRVNASVIVPVAARKTGNLAKERYAQAMRCPTTTTTTCFDKSPGGDYGLWQEKEVKFHLSVERCSLGAGRVGGGSTMGVVDGEVHSRRDLAEWLQRKIGVFDRQLDE